MSARSANVEPRTVPPPAMVSSNGTTLEVAAWAALRWVAIRAMADSRDEDPAAPGLWIGRISLRGMQKRMGKGLLEVIEFDAERFATVKVVEEGGIGLL